MIYLDLKKKTFDKVPHNLKNTKFWSKWKSFNMAKFVSGKQKATCSSRG